MPITRMYFTGARTEAALNTTAAAAAAAAAVAAAVGGGWQDDVTRLALFTVRHRPLFLQRAVRTLTDREYINQLYVVR